MHGGGTIPAPREKRCSYDYVHEKEEWGEHQQEELEANPRETFKVEAHRNGKKLVMTRR